MAILRRIYYWLAGGCGLLIWMLLAQEVHSQKGTAYEYQVKAAFLYNFAKFVEWPEQAFSDEQTPFKIGVLGTNPFGNAFDKVGQKRIKGHSFKVIYFDELPAQEQCHILFVRAEKAALLPQVLRQLDEASVLVIGETEGFVQGGGAINFFLDDGKVRFQINPQAAQRANLKISSKLLTDVTQP